MSYLERVTMGKKQSRTCHYGAQCQNKQCGFKHPDRCIFMQETVSTLPKLDDQKQKNMEEAGFLATMFHTVYMNDMADSIIYTAWDEDEPYVIETYPELGLFPTWDDAYDALLNYVYAKEVPEQLNNDFMLVEENADSIEKDRTQEDGC